MTTRKTAPTLPTTRNAKRIAPLPANPKATSKPKPVTKSVVTFNTALEQFGSQLAIALSAGESLQNCINIMRGTKVKLGTIKSKCQFALSVQSTLQTLTYTKQGKPTKLSSGAVANYLSNIRKCLNDPDLIFSTNMARDKANKVKAKSPSKGEAPEAIPNEVKTCSAKVLEQLKNAVTIIQASEDAEFDIVAVKALIERAMVLINQ
jgi:hypothetical protein